MSVLPIYKMTPEEYLEFERNSEVKHEFIRGEIFAMAGAKENHSVIVWNLGSELRSKLKNRQCVAYPNDMRVFIPQTGLYTYPDLALVCGQSQFQDEVHDTLLNPTMLVEVLSDSTESYDRGRKFQQYRSIESLKEYVLIAQDEARIEKYVKHGDGFWVLSEAVGLDTEIEFESLACVVELKEIYDKVKFQSNDVSSIIPERTGEAD